MTPTSLTVETSSAEETQALGSRLARGLSAAPAAAGGDVLALSGDLGAGKTTFVQGLARGLGITAPVTSPTFVLINRYRTPQGRTLQHADCYRLQHAPLEMWDAGLGDLLNGDDTVVIEWADRLPELLADLTAGEYLEIHFEYLDENRRRLTFRPHGAHYEALLHLFA